MRHKERLFFEQSTYTRSLLLLPLVDREREGERHEANYSKRSSRLCLGFWLTQRVKKVVNLLVKFFKGAVVLD